MDTSRRIARPLFVVAFAASVVCFAAVDTNEQVNASVSNLVALARIYSPAPYFPYGGGTGGGGGSATDTTTNGVAPAEPTGSCDDGNACTISDTFVKGVCQGGIPKDCQDGNSCTNDSCTASTGTCMHTSKNCDDFNPCTADSCDATSGCTHANQDGVLCDDGNPNTTGDLCTAGKCVGAALPLLRGACVVRDSQTNLPSYDDPDSGEGYAKMKKGMIFTSYDAVKNFCMQADYDALGRTFCANNPGDSYQMQVATYNQNNEYQTTGCGNFGCNSVICPAASSSSSAPTLKGACIVRDNHSNLPSYNDSDVGKGYAKVGKGTNFTSYGAVAATCAQTDYDALGRTFCTGNPGVSYQMGAATFNQNNQFQTSGCGNFGCNLIVCPAASSSSSSISSSSVSSSSTAAGTLNGACVLKDHQVDPPTFNAPDVGQGYAKMAKGSHFALADDVRAVCTREDFNTLAQTFCARNPGGTYYQAVATYEGTNRFKQWGCMTSACEDSHCLNVSSSSSVSSVSSSSVSSTATAGLKGACVVRDNVTDLPSYADPDSGEGYAKVGKGTNFASYDAVRASCTQADFDALGRTFCARNPGNFYQMGVATYDQNNHFQTSGCGNSSCNYVTCPDSSSYSSEEEDYSSMGEETSTPPPAGFEEDVITNIVANKTLPPAKYEDAVLANIEAYKSPFPDTDLSQLTGKASAELYRRAAIGGFPDGEFKSDRSVNRAEAAKFLLLTRFGTIGDANNNGHFPDVVDGQWYTKFVITAANKGIINGYPDGLFRPADQVKTAEFLKMLSLTFGLQQNTSYGYNDVPAGSWFAPYAGIAQKYNLFPDRTSLLSPDQTLSRGEVAVAIYQYLVNR